MHQDEPSQGGQASEEQVRQAIEVAQERLLQQRLSPPSSGEEVIAAYEEALDALWKNLAPLLGHAGARAIFERAIQLTQRSHPLIGQVRVAESRLDFGALRVREAPADVDPLKDSLAALLRQVTQVIAHLIGPGLLLMMLGDAALALARRVPDGGADHSQEQPKREDDLSPQIRRTNDANS